MPAHNFKDLTGKPFGKLTVIKRVRRTNRRTAKWWCQCSCGNITKVEGSSLRRKLTRSCGCLRSETTTQCKLIHGKANSPEYKIWSRMKTRCYDSNDKGFKHYGARGITICDKWLNNFMAFYNDVGPRPSPKHSIDRINNNSGYSPTNVKWSTKREQNNNTTRNHFITIDGITHTISQWARRMGVKPYIIINRIRRGWDEIRAVRQPLTR